MVILTIVVAIVLSIFSTSVMSYIAMATPIGPWIAPTLVLVSLLFFRAVSSSYSSRRIVVVVAAGSIGGILATGCAFSFPTIYFLNPVLFNQWMQDPVYFIRMLTVLSASAGGFGLFLANVFEHKVCVQDGLPFPIAVVISKMISTGSQLRKAYELVAGFIGTLLFCIAQDGFLIFKSVVPKVIAISGSWRIAGLHIPAFGFDLSPMFWAIGFITGHLIAIPLAVGAISQLCIVGPLNAWWFKDVPSVEFMCAFCSGMSLLGAIDFVLRMPKMGRQVYVWFYGMSKNRQTCAYGALFVNFIKKIEHSFLLVGVSVLLLMIGFSWWQLCYLLLFSVVFSYQMIVIFGKWGIATLGRFATFVMLPALVLFKIDAVQAVFVALFVEVCGGVACDLLAGRMVAKKNNIDVKTVRRFQYLGLLVSICTVGVVFWLLIHARSLGSVELFAYKAQSRSLLINALLYGNGFNGYVLLLGTLFSFILTRCKFNPLLVLGGLLMPLNLSIGLIFGGMLTYLVKDREAWEPFWSGVFAAHSVWMLLRAVL